MTSESIANLYGKGSSYTLRELFERQLIQGKLLKEARYLGPMVHHSGSFFPERQRRVAADNRVWTSFRSFYLSATPWRPRLLMFKALNLSAHDEPSLFCVGKEGLCCD